MDKAGSYGHIKKKDFMAKVSKPLNSENVSGSLSGLIFNNHRGSSVVRSSRAPSRHNNANTLKSKSLFSDVSKSFQTLTAAQRQLWDNFAKKPLSGYSLYCSHTIASSRCLLYLNKILIPPKPQTPKKLTGNFSLSDSFLNFEINEFGFESDYCELKAKINCAPGRSYSIKEMNISVIQSYGLEPVYSISSEYNDSKTIIFYRYINSETGYCGPWLSEEFPS